MTDNRNTILRKLLLRTGNRSRLWAALIALCVGTTLLLATVLIWWNFNELLYGRDRNDSLGSTFLIVGKKVTEQNMAVKGAVNFTDQDVADMQQAPQVQEVGTITSNHFPIYATMGGNLAMATDLPLESVPDKFLDNMPGDWKWQPGDKQLPIIVSSQFLDLYNYVFAPSQGLPQLSEGSVKSIGLTLKVGSGGNVETYIAHVVGFSDRIGSVLAPASFIQYGNQKFGRSGTTGAPTQLILRTKDPSDVKFAGYLKEKNYTTNSQNLRWSRIRSVVEVVTSATGILALLIMGISTLVFVLFIELTVARARDSITLLLQLGYSPSSLSRFMSARFLPLVLGAVSVSAIIVLVAQFTASSLSASSGLRLATVPGWQVWAAWLISSALLTMLVTRAIRSAIHRH